MKGIHDFSVHFFVTSCESNNFKIKKIKQCKTFNNDVNIGEDDDDRKSDYIGQCQDRLNTVANDQTFSNSI